MPDGALSWSDDAESRQREARRRRVSAEISAYSPLAGFRRDLSRAQLDRQRQNAVEVSTGDSAIESGIPGIRARPSDINLMAGSVALPGAMRAMQAPRALSGTLGALRLLMRDHPNLWKEPTQFRDEEIDEEVERRVHYPRLARGGALSGIRWRHYDEGGGGANDGSANGGGGDTSTNGGGGDAPDSPGGQETGISVSDFEGPPTPETGIAVSDFEGLFGLKDMDDRNFNLADLQAGLGLRDMAERAGLYGGLSQPGYHDPGLAGGLASLMNNPSFGMTPDITGIGPSVVSAVRSIMEHSPIGAMISAQSPLAAMSTMAGVTTGLPLGTLHDAFSDGKDRNLGMGHDAGTGAPSTSGADPGANAGNLVQPNRGGVLAQIQQQMQQQQSGGPPVSPVVYDALNFNPYTGGYTTFGTNPPGHHFFI